MRWRTTGAPSAEALHCRAYLFLVIYNYVFACGEKKIKIVQRNFALLYLALVS